MKTFKQLMESLTGKGDSNAIVHHFTQGNEVVGTLNAEKAKKMANGREISQTPLHQYKGHLNSREYDGKQGKVNYTSGATLESTSPETVEKMSQADIDKKFGSSEGLQKMKAKIRSIDIQRGSNKNIVSHETTVNAI